MSRSWCIKTANSPSSPPDASPCFNSPNATLCLTCLKYKLWFVSSPLGSSKLYLRVVKSISLGFASSEPAARSQVHDVTGRAPQAQELPLTGLFSEAALSQLHSPAGRARHEQRAPVISFSVVALSQLQLSADCLPQEQVACLAGGGGRAQVSLLDFKHGRHMEERDIPQTHSPPSFLPQHVGVAWVTWEDMVVDLVVVELAVVEYFVEARRSLGRSMTVLVFF